ncbi:xanthine dehydrogenase family protein subunit M [Streptomyces sp. MST-110588]|uniref:FAD binding domain-containing protein n=1 Tax=Streptomyces sp. MST-110588 TaxID=2833628 RepID=UPI001F5D18D4|nr:xanthine dehydrogenase family protein subunit M [Streptomyces sp. MST-110588]UNO38477.1 xanthine dehydrogenase family protein subunit M [Streptomyces sp. MST-110588]
MKTFTYERATTLQQALTARTEPGTQLLAGGTELLNWLKEGIERPERVVDINGLPLDGIDVDDDGLRLGALARMSDVHAHPEVARRYPAITESLLRSASAQLRNMASIGGNLLQRTRCPYFRADTALPCNKREPGSGCAALAGGDTGAHALFGWSPACAATHPSDLAVALAALDAVVVTESGRRGRRRIPVTEFHRLPQDRPELHTRLRPDELVTGVEVPPDHGTSWYLKVRERASYEFALVSVAVSVEVEGEVINRARLALGSVAPRPWRLWAAEDALVGVALSDVDGLRSAVAASFEDALPLPDNAYKIELAQRAAVRALRVAGGAA